MFNRQALVARHSARDATARQSAWTELEAAQPRGSQYSPGTEIPERSWAYRIAKKIAFHEYGVYSKHFDAERWVAPERTASSVAP